MWTEITAGIDDFLTPRLKSKKGLPECPAALLAAEQI